MFLMEEKTKRTAKFDGEEPRRRDDIRGIIAPERSPKSFGTSEKRAPGPRALGKDRIHEITRITYYDETENQIMGIASS